MELSSRIIFSSSLNRAGSGMNAKGKGRKNGGVDKEAEADEVRESEAELVSRRSP